MSEIDISNPAAAAMTLAQWAVLPENQPGELVDGRLEEEEMPTYVHEFLVSWLIVHIGSWVLPLGGWLFGSEAKIAVAPDRGRKPDVCVYLPGSRPPAGRSSVATRAPGIAIEVVSPLPRDARRDRIEKLADYARAGVRWYWLMDPGLRTLEILELGADGRYVHRLGASTGRVDVPGCGGLTLDLDGLWRDVDRLEAETDEDAGEG